jgi:methyl coenzyme M reductase alpha subunit
MFIEVLPDPLEDHDAWAARTTEVAAARRSTATATAKADSGISGNTTAARSTACAAKKRTCARTSNAAGTHYAA